jgi:hypothetical protein
MREPELFAIRAYVARAESRLATMHGVAGAFISGAGLLLLLPIFYRDAANPFLTTIIDDLRAGTSASSGGLLLLGWAIPFVCALILPIYAVYLMIEQLVVLYFLPHGQTDQYLLPRFALAPLAMPIDDPEVVDEIATQRRVSSLKLQIIEAIYTEQNITTVIPRAHSSRELMNLTSIGHRFPGILNLLPERTKHGGADGSDAWAYNVRAAKTGLRDRTLVEEAARIEVALVRFAARLRVMPSGISSRYWS